MCSPANYDTGLSKCIHTYKSVRLLYLLLTHQEFLYSTLASESPICSSPEHSSLASLSASEVGKLIRLALQQIHGQVGGGLEFKVLATERCALRTETPSMAVAL